MATTMVLAKKAKAEKKIIDTLSNTFVQLCVLTRMTLLGLRILNPSFLSFIYQ